MLGHELLVYEKEDAKTKKIMRAILPHFLKIKCYFKDAKVTSVVGVTHDDAPLPFTI